MCVCTEEAEGNRVLIVFMGFVVIISQAGHTCIETKRGYKGV